MNRVWTFIIGRDLNEQEMQHLQHMGEQFVKTWTAHEQALVAEFSIVNKRIVVVKVNESVHEASGCSIDKLSYFIKQAEKQFNTEMLNRLLVALKTPEGLTVVHSSKIKDLLSAGKIQADTMVYNTAAANENELAQWEQPLLNTWLKKYL
jgi:hypothetical protein